MASPDIADRFCPSLIPAHIDFGKRKAFRGFRKRKSYSVRSPRVWHPSFRFSLS